MAAILLIEDDYDLAQSFRKILQREGYTVLMAGSAEDGLDLLASNPIELILMDIQLPGMSGMECFAALKTREDCPPVIIMTAFGSYDVAIEAIRQGAFDFITKPFEVPVMLKMIHEALKAAEQHPLSLDFATDDTEAIIGTSHAMQVVYKAIGRTAPTNVTVLIEGESGTGKELVARALHRYSHRALKPFQIINCVAIPEALLESELFGFEKGSFTGADNRRLGSIERASGGTLFLDEIGDMPASIQAKILRLLQEKQFQRLGSPLTLPADVRIIAATNRNLEQAIREGHFREDLYYRLNVVRITMPSLRERREDIPLLAEHFIKRSAREMGCKNPGIDAEAMTLLCAQAWPGNVRELANVILKALIFSRGCRLGRVEIREALDHTGQESDLQPRLRQWIRSRLETAAGSNLHARLTADFDELVLKTALELTGGNQSRAARLLGISRQNLQSRIKRHAMGPRKADREP